MSTDRDKRGGFQSEPTRAALIVFMMMGAVVTALVWSGVSLNDVFKAVHAWLTPR